MNSKLEACFYEENTYLYFGVIQQFGYGLFDPAYCGSRSSMNNSIKKLIARNPRLDETLRHLYVWGVFWIRRKPGFSHWIHERIPLITPWEWARIPAESGELFFGYYDRTPWDNHEDRMLFHFRKRYGNPRVEIRVFDRKSGESRAVGSSRTWNFQQGARAQWLEGGSEPLIIFNDIAARQYVSRIVDATGKEHAEIPYPVQSVHPAGTEAISLNYRRLWKYRPAYGYRLPADNFQPDQPLDRDGLWRVDLRSGRGELIVSLSQLMAISPKPSMNPNRTKVNHVMYSPSGDRCVFLHRWFRDGEKTHRLYRINSDGSDLQLILETSFLSHYYWRDDETLIAYGTPAVGQTGYFEISIAFGNCRALSGHALDGFADGHPSYSTDRQHIVTDTYPDRRFEQLLIAYHIAKDDAVVIGRFIHPPRYYRQTRCDLHPRWSPGGRYVSFDSVYSGTRRSYILDTAALWSADTHQETLIADK